MVHPGVGGEVEGDPTVEDTGDTAGSLETLVQEVTEDGLTVRRSSRERRQRVMFGSG